MVCVVGILQCGEAVKVESDGTGQPTFFPALKRENGAEMERGDRALFHTEEGSVKVSWAVT